MYDRTMNFEFVGAPMMSNQSGNFPACAAPGFQNNVHGEDQLLSNISAKNFQWDTTPVVDQQVARPTTLTSGLGSNFKQAAAASAQPSLNSLTMQAANTTATKPKRTRKRCPNPPKKMTELPEDFVPSDYSVLCGKGSDNYNAIGNRRFRLTVGMFLQRYRASKDRHEKSDCVRRVMEIIREACPVGAFITQRDGRWYNVDERTAREKVGAFFRDSLHEHYKSSAKSKIARRKQKRRTSSTSSTSSESVTSEESGLSFPMLN